MTQTDEKWEMSWYANNEYHWFLSKGDCAGWVVVRVDNYGTVCTVRWNARLAIDREQNTMKVKGWVTRKGEGDSLVDGMLKAEAAMKMLLLLKPVEYAA